MNSFIFNQDPKTRDCGYRCLYYVIQPPLPYHAWLKTLYHTDPVSQGVKITHIIEHLGHLGIRAECQSMQEEGLYIVLATGWLPGSGGHYLIYDNGIVCDSVDTEPRKMSLADFKSRAGGMTAIRILF